MFIYNIRIPKHKNTNDFFFSGTKHFITFELKSFSTSGERFTFFLCWLFHLPPLTCGVRSAQIRLASPRSQSQLTDFSQISAHASGAWRHSHPWSYPLSGIFIVTSLNDSSAPRAREHLRSCLLLTNPCTKRKVPSLTKPKGKIYKTKPLGRYITVAVSTIHTSLKTPIGHAMNFELITLRDDSNIFLRSNLF